MTDPHTTARRLSGAQRKAMLTLETGGLENTLSGRPDSRCFGLNSFSSTNSARAICPMSASQSAPLLRRKGCEDRYSNDCAVSTTSS